MTLASPRNVVDWATNLAETVGDAYQAAMDLVDNNIEKRLKKVKLKDCTTSVDKRFLDRVSTAATMSQHIYEKSTRKARRSASTNSANWDGTGIEERVLSRDKNGDPDCVIRYSGEIDIYGSSNTIWVILRGTATSTDVITDLSWLLHTQRIGNYNTPSLVAKKARTIFPSIVTFVEEIFEQQQQPLRIVFAGHSLGGALAQCMYWLWQSTEWAREAWNFETEYTDTYTANSRGILRKVVYEGMRGEVFSFGSPHVLAIQPSTAWKSTYRSSDGGSGSGSEEPEVVPSFFRITALSATRRDGSTGTGSFNENGVTHESRGTSTDRADVHSIGSYKLASRVHHFIYMLDPIPRILGNHHLPSYLMATEVHGRRIANERIESRREERHTDLQQVWEQMVSNGGDDATSTSTSSNKRFFSTDNLRTFHRHLLDTIHRVRQHYTPCGRYYLLTQQPMQQTQQDRLKELMTRSATSTDKKKGYRSLQQGFVRLREDPSLLYIQTEGNSRSRANTAGYAKDNTQDDDYAGDASSILEIFPDDWAGFALVLPRDHNIKATVEALAWLGKQQEQLKERKAASTQARRDSL